MKNAMPPAYFLASVILILVLHFLIPVYTLLESPWTLLGIIPVLLGLLFNAWGDLLFKRANTTIKPFEESSHLVIDGVFAISRNPMYLGMASSLAGIALLMGSASPWIAVIAFVGLINHRFIRKEEIKLSTTFGAEYEAYRKRVRRWL